MTESPDLPELLLGADESFRTVRATIRNWRDDVKYMEAWERHLEAWQRRLDELEDGSGGGVGTFLVEVDREQEPESPEELVRIWLAGQERVRVEVEGRWARTMVSDGTSTWIYMAHTGAIRDKAGGGLAQSMGSLLLKPAVLVSRLDFEAADKTEFLGREALHARAKPRSAELTMLWHDLHGLAPGAHEYDLVVDVERGILLRAGALMDGEAFASSEVIEVAFDERLEPDIFTFTPPPGEIVQTSEEAFGGWIDDVSIEEAAARAPFTVFASPTLWPDWTINVHFYPGKERPRLPAVVSIHYMRDDDRPAVIDVSQRAVRENEPEPGPDWERLDRAGQAVYVYKPSEQKTRWPILIQLQREGTRIRMQSDGLGRELLLDFAELLVPVPTDPPRRP